MSTAQDEWPQLEAGEELVTARDELLWRQIHPRRISDGMISSEAFEPGRSDDKRLSCSRESKTSAKEAFEHYTTQAELTSAGSAAIAVGEVESDEPTVEGNPAVPSLRAVDDSGNSSPSNPLPPGHTYVDFRPLGSSRITKKAKQLAFYAMRRGGIQHP